MFDTAHHATTAAAKLRRSLQLGGRYYLAALPRYLAARRRRGMGWWDGGALVNPLRELRRRSYASFDLPPGYPEALADLGTAGVRLTMPRLRLEALLGIWWAARQASGDAIECGAYRGGTALLLAVLGVRNGIDQTVHLADTFSGLPEVSPLDPLRRVGEYGDEPGLPDLIRVQADRLGVIDRIELHVGRFAATLPGLAAAHPGLELAFAHVDANVYAGTRDACRFVLPRLGPGAGVVFDDYNGVLDLGARLAIDECLAGSGLVVRNLAWSSAFAQTLA